jgi:D-3-phosphoglycerate dehydrogenase / 2-oxoglutarate reductase
VKVVLVDPLDRDGVSRLRAAGLTVEFAVASSQRTDSEWIEASRGAAAIVVRSTTHVDRAALTQLAAAGLRAVACAGIGIDNVDEPAASELGVAVLNAPGANAVSAAEHTWALLLAVARRVPEADRSMKEGRWQRETLRGFELEGKVLGVVGFGRVGSRVAARGNAFGMTVLACDPYLEPSWIEERRARPVALEALLEASDVVTLHVPLTAETRHMIDARALARTREGVVLLNVARGAVVDEAALLKGLESGHVRAAGLDVFETEPVVDSPLARHPRVIATPHVGARTAEAQLRVSVELADRIVETLKSGPRVSRP